MLTTDYKDGAPNWVDVAAPDISRAAGFYRELFGWDYHPGGAGIDGYGTFRLYGARVAGGMTMPEDQTEGAWTVYFQSRDADATAEAARRAGGTVVLAPMDVTGHGRAAVLTDPAGIGFGVWQPGRTKGLDAVAERGTLSWTELYTPDVAAAAEFYRAVLGWQITEAELEGGTYTFARPAASAPTADTGFAGIVSVHADPAEDTGRPYWTPYFEVTDCDATAAHAEELGGKVRLAPVFMEGAGRFAKLADPDGARFAVIASADAPKAGA
ncbi:VOC family protein [Streptomyces sp. NPDC048603]|uniref:VOC family protein n=1 Tax=Streptomyces sp. NPDC048603 TaxID=3365577 RepID=UPI0037164E60